MQTKLPENLLNLPYGQTADKIIRSCVHCGFCLATCPTYQLLGNELDSPRGRIYLIKNALEGYSTTRESLIHLDRCLTCRSCESTCPSGVEYGHLLDIGRDFIERKKIRPLVQRASRYGLRKILTIPLIFNSLIAIRNAFKKYQTKSNKHQTKLNNLSISHSATKGKVMLLSGCVQVALSPQINISTKSVLSKLGYEVIESSQKSCCGAIHHHLSDSKKTIEQVKQNIDTWLPLLSENVKAIISTASGCGVMLKDYPHLLKDDPDYAPKAKALDKIVMDISEFINKQDLSILKKKISPQKISFHAPCTLQHGLKIDTLVEKILSQLGFEIKPVKDKHLCCGSAGTYSIFQPEISNQLRNNKLKNLLKYKPNLVVSANIGCQEHLQKGTKTPLLHWVELLDI